MLYIKLQQIRQLREQAEQLGFYLFAKSLVGAEREICYQIGIHNAMRRI